MQWLQLLSKLSFPGLRYTQAQLTDVDIFACQRISEGISYTRGVLYLGAQSQLDSLEKKGVPRDVPLLCLGDGDDMLGYANSALVEPGVSMFELESEVAALLAGEGFRNVRIQQLIAAYNANRGLQHLVDTASGFLQNPILVVDVSYKILAMSQNYLPSRPDIEQQRSLGYILNENVERLKQDEIYAKSRKTLGPFYYNSTRDDQGTGWMTVPLYLNNIEVGHIDVMESTHPFTDNDYALVRFLSELVSLELQKNDFYRANRGFMHSFFLTELLEGQVADESIVRLRLQHLNWTPTEYLYVMLVSDNHPGMVEGKTKIISQQIHTMLPGSRWAIHNGALVFLLSFPDRDRGFMAPEGQLTEYLAVNDLSAAVSERFSSLLKTSVSYDQARQAMALGKRLEPDRTLFYYPDYLCYHIAGALGKQYDMADFIHPAIFEIMQYDKAHNAKLMETLDAHLRHSDNPTQVAASLYIHRNTLFYRLGKIRELFGIDLADGEERLRIQLSLKFLRMLEHK